MLAHAAIGHAADEPGAPAEAQPRSTEPSRAELQLTVGLAMPAQFTPEIVRHTYTDVGP
jgi:hypothetical protein